MLGFVITAAIAIVCVYVAGAAITWTVLTVQAGDVEENAILAAVWPVVLWVLILEIFGI